jgi:sugar lactone lactonase YvrE
MVDETLFVSRQLTPGEYTSGIEGPAVDVDGNLYVVNLGEHGTIGRLKPGAAKSELFAKLPSGSIGNGIRFDRSGRMYVADHKKHRVFVFEHGQSLPRLYFHSAAFNQPNDLAIATDGTLYASDPRIKKSAKNQVWRITREPGGTARGEVMSCERELGKVNGIDLSPDGKILYVSESDTRQIWAYRPQGAKLAAPHPVREFDGPPKSELDGLRTDNLGRIFVTRPGNGTVAIVAPTGDVVREVPLLGKDPSNLTFGGPGGKTVFVTQVDGRFVEAFRTDRPGREPFPKT